jgi:NAD-dependent DNA ligase
MRDFLEEASVAYYAGYPIISDAEYDVLFAHFGHDQIGHKVTDGIEHYWPMWSLQKCFDLAEAPFPIESAVASPKLDGAAVSLLYVNGTLKLGLTRGDGKIGKDITAKLAMLVPERIPYTKIIQITGEVVCPAEVPNARNVAAGSLNLKSLEEFSLRPLSFVAYGIEGITWDTWTDSMSALFDSGFHVVNKLSKYPTYPTDGVVYRINNTEDFLAQGYTSHHPRGAFALKEQAKGLVTTLRSVEWQVGKSGTVSPVGIFDPVEIGGAVVSRATLHNIQYIEALNLELGCQVEVIRSGEIIPRILRRID